MPEPSPAELQARAVFDGTVGRAPPDANGVVVSGLQDVFATEQFFQAACATGDVPPLTLDAADWENAPPDTTERQRAIHMRLARLGYPVPSHLRENETGDALWASLRDAWGRFQHDAFPDGLPVGVIAGELSVADWDALQELFNFEATMHVERWFRNGEPLPALQRAARLRLQVAGFGDAPTLTEIVPSPGALRGFAETIHDLGVTSTPLPAALTPEFAALLFDYENLTEALASCGGRLAALPPDAAARARGFLLCVAKVELWLQGRNVSPDGDATLTVSRMVINARGQFERKIQPTSLSAEFDDFMGDLKPDVTPARTIPLSDRVPELLALSRNLRSSEARMSSGELVAQLRMMLAEDDSLWAKIVQTGKSLVSTLFDGARRVFSWLGRLVRRGIQAVRDAVRTIASAAVNIWRGVYHFMGGVAFYLRRALRAFADGVRFLFDLQVGTNPTGSAVWARRLDCDGALVIDAGADPAAVSALGASLERGARCFAIACRIIRLVTNAVRTLLLSGATGLAGFAPLILGLASAFQEVRELGQLLTNLGA